MGNVSVMKKTKEDKRTDSHMIETCYLGRGVKEDLSEEVTFEKINELRNRQVTHTTKFTEGQTVNTFNFFNLCLYVLLAQTFKFIIFITVTLEMTVRGRTKTCRLSHAKLSPLQNGANLPNQVILWVYVCMCF